MGDGAAWLSGIAVEGELTSLSLFTSPNNWSCYNRYKLLHRLLQRKLILHRLHLLLNPAEHVNVKITMMSKFLPIHFCRMAKFIYRSAKPTYS